MPPVPRSVLDLTDWPVRTARLTLRPLAPADLPAVFAIRSRPEVRVWMSGVPESYEAFAADWNADESRWRGTLVAERDGVVVGDQQLEVLDAWGQREVADAARGSLAELGWVVDPSYAGQGLATEIGTALLEIAFDRLGVHRVIARAFAGNAPSLRVMDKIGLRRESYGVGDLLHREHGWSDSVTTALLAEEWRGKRV